MYPTSTVASLPSLLSIMVILSVILKTGAVNGVIVDTQNILKQVLKPLRVSNSVLIIDN